MQAASCLWEEEYQGEYCRLIRVSVIIVGYVRFRLKLNLEAILESKAILLQKICSGHQNERIALRLCQPKFVKKLDCRFFFFFFHFMQYSYRVCNLCGRKIRNLGQFYQFIKTANTSTARTPVKSSKHTLDTSDKASPAWRKSKSVRVNSRAAKSPSIEGSTSATKGKSRKSLSFSLLEKIKKPKSLWPQKRSKKMLLQQH